MRFLLEHTKEKTIKFYFLDSNNTISVFSDYFEFSTIIEDTIDWFEECEEDVPPDVWIVNSFDGSVLELALISNGNVVISYVTGDGAEEYGKIKKDFDESKICERFNVSKEEINKAYDDDAETALDNFSKLLNLPLNENILSLKEQKTKELDEWEFSLGLIN